MMTVNCYDELFEARQSGDCIEQVKYNKEQVDDWLNKAKDFVEKIKLMVDG